MHEGHSIDIQCLYLSVLAAVYYLCSLYVENSDRVVFLRQRCVSFFENATFKMQ